MVAKVDGKETIVLKVCMHEECMYTINMNIIHMSLFVFLVEYICIM